MTKLTQLTFKDRELILKLASQDFSQGYIAKEIGKHQSTVSRELNRLGMNKNTYCLAKAQVDRNQKASLRGRPPKLTTGSKLCEFIKNKIVNLRWSPEQVSGYLKKDKRSKQISHETIYHYIYSLKDSTEKAFWIESLRRKRRKRCSRKSQHDGRGQIPNRISIHCRPESVESREEGGHWEGDLLIGKNHASAIGTIVERTSRLTIIVQLPNERTSSRVVSEFSNELLDIPLCLRKSLTYDNGREMSQHQTLCSNTGMQVFFADPGCPGQRGTNENTNGLIREFFPKRTDFSKVSRQELKQVENLLNQRPRKILGYATPNEAFNAMLKRSKPPDKTTRPERREELR